MPSIRKISSCPLVKSEISGLWLPDECRRVGSNNFCQSRRQFVGLATAGILGSVILNSSLSKKADAQVLQLIPVVLAGLQIIDLVIDWRGRLKAKAILRNEKSSSQNGRLGLRLISAQNQQIYDGTDFIDSIPARTENIYYIEERTPGPVGRNYLTARTAENSLEEAYSVV